MLLNGMWSFSFDGGRETTLPVPGCFDTEPEFRWKRGIGTYRRTVECGGRCELKFGGIGLRAEIFWDGVRIAEEKTAYTPLSIRFDAGKKGTHELKVVCDNTRDETPESQFRVFYDFYGYGGIYRDVSLRELPESNLVYVRILPLDPASGRVSLHVETEGPEAPLSVSFDGGAAIPLDSRDSEVNVPSPRLWSLEDPFLHTARVAYGRDVSEIRFGLRTVEAKDRKIYLNGTPVKLIGVNRHDVWPDTGAAVPCEVLRRDLQMIKNAGMNCIRGSHYPQSEAMLALTDELGLLVWDEILGWENPPESMTNEEFQRRQLDAAERMVRDSVNHPSVILWGALNEAYTNFPGARDLVRKLTDLFHKEDPTRLTTRATMWGLGDAALDIDDVISFNSYPAWYVGNEIFFDPVIVHKTLDDLVNGVKEKIPGQDKPILISEIGAAALIGDRSGRRWSEDYQEQLILCVLDKVRNDPRIAGVFFWQFCNTPVDNNSSMFTRPRGYNNKGLVDEYRRPKLVWPSLIRALASR